MYIILDGCGVRPAICTNREKIDELEPIVQALSVELLGKYDGMDTYYSDISEVFNNSIYIELAITNILEGVDEALNYTLHLNSYMYENLDETIANYSTLTDQAKADLLASPIEWMLEQVQQMDDYAQLKSEFKMGWKIGTFLASKAFRAAFKDNWKNYKYKSMMGNGFKTKFKNKLKTVMKASWSDFKNFFGTTKIGTNVYTKITTKFTALQAAFSDPKGTFKAYVNSIRIPHSIFNAIGILASSIGIALEDKNWNDLDNVSILFLLALPVKPTELYILR